MMPAPVQLIADGWQLRPPSAQVLFPEGCKRRAQKRIRIMSCSSHRDNKPVWDLSSEWPEFRMRACRANGAVQGYDSLDALGGVW